MPPFAYEDWRDLRIAVRETVARHMQGRFPGLRIGPIDYDALRAARRWPPDDRAVSWDWKRITKRLETERIDAAFWTDTVLCGLAYGRVTDRGPTLTRLEGSPRADHRLKGHVTDLAIAVLEATALALDAPRTLLEDPDPDLMGWYERKGYRRVAEPELARYLVKERQVR